MQQMRQQVYFGETYGRFRGQDWELVRLEFTGETTDYGGFLVHRDSRMIVRSTDGAERSVRLFGAILEQDGAFKIYSFIVD